MDSNILTNGRTRGDGMEFVDTTSSDRSNIKFPSTSNTNTPKCIDESTNRLSTIPGAMTIYRSNDNDSNSVKLPAKVPKGKPFYLVPHLVNTKKTYSLKNKAPKFVPFEPYKAAVSIFDR